jgi:hypothetical protein
MRKDIFRRLFLGLFLLAFVSDCPAQDYAGKKILCINSYHKGYAWSDQEFEGLEGVLGPTKVTWEVIYMDTKNNPSDAFSKKAALKVKKYIEEFEPDVVISADDNAFRDVIMAYYRDSELPVVFCGINWDISVYDGPYSNTTGMIEVGMGEGIFKHLKKYARGKRAGFLGADMLSERKNATYFAQYIEGGFERAEFVLDSESWKEKYLELIDEVDMLYLATPEGIKGWDYQEVGRFVMANMKIPIGTESDTVMPFALLGLIKVPQEQGEYAAKAALEILDGKKPSDIPVVINKKGTLLLNVKVADKLGVIFSPAMLRNAQTIYGIEE